MVDRAPHFVRFCRALALLSGTTLIAACSSTGDVSTSESDARDDAGHYDGVPVGVAPCEDGGCGLTIDADTDSAYHGDVMGVAPGDAMGTLPPPTDAAVDTNPDVPAGGPGAAPDLPFFA